MEIQILKRRVAILLWFFIVALLLSGLTAFPLEWELDLLSRLATGPASPLPGLWPDLAAWIGRVNAGLQDTYGRYPFMAYGTDWLAFAHLMIAVAFIGPFRDPVRNVWVIEFGMIACVAVIPTALIAGGLRGIPLWWRLIDCSFGVFGIIPLWAARGHVKRLERIPTDG